MALKCLYQIDMGIDTPRLRELSQVVARACGFGVPPWKAIVGENAFAHESGIHGHGVLKNPATYEPFAPEEVGWERRLVAGKHSGRHLLSSMLQQYGIALSSEESQSLLDAVRNLSVQVKRSLTPEELLNLVENRRVVSWHPMN